MDKFGDILKKTLQIPVYLNNYNLIYNEIMKSWYTIQRARYSVKT